MHQNIKRMALNSQMEIVQLNKEMKLEAGKLYGPGGKNIKLCIH